MPMNPRLRACARRVAVLFLLAGAAHAQAANVPFGTRSLQIPNPTGFEAVAARAPEYARASQAYLPAGNQLLDVYVPPAAATALAAGKPTGLDRYFQLQVPRQFAGVIVPHNDFAAGRAQIEQGMAAQMKQADALAAELTQQGNAAVKRQTHVDPALSLSGVRYLGVYRREPWGLFFTVKSRIGGAVSSEEQVGSGVFALINYQVVYLYDYATYHDERDRRWAEQALSAWADAIHAANPDDPAVAAQTGLSRADKVKLLGLAGAIGGGLVGVLIALYVQRRRSARS